MANRNGRCVVCGASPTVKSHLFPRAMMLDMRTDDRPLIEASRHRPGYVERQNGIWDDRFLCKTHEDAAGGGDDYAIRLSRRLLEKSWRHPEGDAYQIDNPKPELLQRFVYGTVWRHVAAPISALSKLRLGPYQERIEHALFNGGPFDLPIIAAITNVTGQGGRLVPMALAPYRTKLMDTWVWHFVVGYFDLMLKTDGRPWPVEWRPYLADRDPLTLFQADRVDLATVPFLRELTDRVRASPYRGKRKG